MDCSGTGQVAQTGQSWRAKPPIGKTESHPPRDVGPGSWRSCPDRARRRAKKSGATQGSQEITLDGHPRLAPDRGASHQHQGDRGAQIVLMEAEGLAQQPAGARPLDRLAHLAPSHHTQLRGRPARQADPVRDETSTHNATPALADIGKLTGAAKARLARQGQGRCSLDSHSKKTVGRRQTRRRGRNLAPSRKSRRPSRCPARLPPPLAGARGSDGGQPLASDPAAARQDRPASFACVAGQKTVLAFQSNLRWLVLTFHANAIAVPHPGPHGKSRCHRGLRRVRSISKRRDNTSEPGCVKRVRRPPGGSGASDSCRYSVAR